MVNPICEPCARHLGRWGLSASEHVDEEEEYITSGIESSLSNDPASKLFDSFRQQAFAVVGVPDMEVYPGNMARMAALVLFGIFLFVTLFGLPMLLSHDGHHTGCPLGAVGEVMCESTIIEHFSIWSSMFASMFASFALLIGFVGISVRLHIPAYEHIRLRQRKRTPARPTLFQELYSRGILNRKEPYAFL